MKIAIGKQDVLMSGGVLAGLEYGSVNELGMNAESGNSMDMGRMLDRLRNNPDIALELLSYDGPIIYMGAEAMRRTAEGRTLGMRFTDGGYMLDGDNEYGRFLSDVRNAYLHELAEEIIEEALLRPDQIIVDYSLADNGTATMTELQEGRGRKFIHTEPYRPSKFNFDTAMDGTTGHAQRMSGSDVPFQTFECPFGLDYKSKIRVESAAEVSLLYEKAIRGDIDWKVLIGDLKTRGLIKNLSKVEESDLIRDLDAQFHWMREQICRDRELRRIPIVADSMLIPDASFGRSIYDPYTAPSPAHILARYINNPKLLFSRSENSVLRALETNDKNEPYRFSAATGKGRVSIVIDGSDTIGGRELHTRATREQKPVYLRDENGKIVYNKYGEPIVKNRQDIHRLQFKSKEDIESDYVSFSQRLETVISNISPDIEVEFVTGKGIGVPQMVRRYVQEHGGHIFDWDYNRKKMIEEPNDKAGVSRFSQLRMQRMDKIVPVLVGREDFVSFLLNPDDDESDVKFGREDVITSGLVEFTVTADRHNADLLRRGSIAMGTGFPVIHVQENRTEQEQIISLASESSLVKNAFIGEQTFSESLFSSQPKNSWDLATANVMSYVDRDNNIAIPNVSYVHDASVYVNSVAYHSVFAAFTALVMKESGVKDIAEFQRLAANEDSMQVISETLARYNVSDEVQEKCMRNSVHLMAQASSVFSDYLLSTGASEIVLVSSFGGDRIFTDLDGNGENRFGVVLQAERSLISREVEIERQKAEAESLQIAEENARLQRRANTRRARGEKMTGGLPKDIGTSDDAVWFLGTSRPSQLCIPGDGYSFIRWEECDYGKDALNRELASRPRLDDGEGGEVENRLVFLCPSDLLAVTGRRHVKNNPDSKDLTGVKRVNPDTGQEFVCGFGIPVKRDNLYYEFDNKIGRTCSFRLDRDGSDFLNSIIAADALARTTAIQQNMALCYSVRERNLPGGEENDDLSRVFIDKIWDYPRTREVIDRNSGKTISEGGAILPREVSRRVYNSETQKYEKETRQVYSKQWVDNPHAAPRLKAMIKRYEKMLVEGANFPLNCICLPETDYSNVSEDKFLADFSFALSIANATAIAQDKPMRFPLDQDGRLYLGPDIPENLRDLAERKLDSFIQVVREENIINDALPYISRISIYDSVKQNTPLKGDGSDLYIRPNDLMAAFGPYDFKDVLNGMTVPIHEMAFTTEDGTLFRVTNPRLTRNLSTGDINRYMRYEKNDECRFTVKSSDPDKIPAFITALKSYIERAKRIKVETRLLSEQEAAGQNLGMEGFMRLLSSNTEEVPNDDNVIAPRGDATALDAPNRFDGTDVDSSYYGKVDAKDAFAGYAQFKYILPDGTESGWRIVSDKEIATDLIYSKVNRVYRSDIRVVPLPNVLNAELVSLAIKDAGEHFRSLTQQVSEVKVDTKVVESERYVPEEKPAAAIKEDKQERGRVFVTYYGSRSIPEDSFKVRISNSCPPGMVKDMDIEFKSMYPDYTSMVDAHKKGKIDDAEYSRRYNEKVLQPNKEKILNGMKSVIETAKEEGKDIYLYCYCKPGAFCHRYLVNNFLNENGIACQENPKDRLMYRQGHVQLFGEESMPVSEEKEIFETVDKKEASMISYTRSVGSYQQRTRENATSDDVDFTFQFAVDFSTFGEQATAKAAGDSLISIELPVTDGKLQCTKKAVNDMVQQIVNALPEDFIKGEPFGVNLAGNGIYTLNQYGIDQQSLDTLMVATAMALEEKGIKIRSWRSGGQTGVDETAAAIGQVLGVPTIIHAPANFAFRGVNGIDVKGDEQAFKERFESKDYDAIMSKAEKLLGKKNIKKFSQGITHS